MKQSRNTISDWLEKHGDPKIKEQVEKEAKEILIQNKIEMKTPMQEVYDNFNKMSDADFKSWMLNTDLLDKEKEVIMNAWINGHDSDCLREQEERMFAELYYDATFNTK